MSREEDAVEEAPGPVDGPPHDPNLLVTHSRVTIPLVTLPVTRTGSRPLETGGTLAFFSGVFPLPVQAVSPHLPLPAALVHFDGLGSETAGAR